MPKDFVHASFTNTVHLLNINRAVEPFNHMVERFNHTLLLFNRGRLSTGIDIRGLQAAWLSSGNVRFQGSTARFQSSTV